MSGFGDAEVTHLLKSGRYRCGIDLQDNLFDNNPAQFRVQFRSPLPISAPLVTSSEPTWRTDVEIAVIGGDGSNTGEVDVLVRAAPRGYWSLQCDLSEQLETNSMTRVTVMAAAPIDSGEVNPVTVRVNGSGASRVPVKLEPDTLYMCALSVEHNVDEHGAAAPFIVLIDDEPAADVVADYWEGEYQYARQSDEAEGRGFAVTSAASAESHRVDLTVTAGDYSEWSMVCVPQPG